MDSRWKAPEEDWGWFKGGFIRGRGSTGQDVGGGRERRGYWTVWVEGEGVRPGRLGLRGQVCLTWRKQGDEAAPGVGR